MRETGRLRKGIRHIFASKAPVAARHAAMLAPSRKVRGHRTFTVSQSLRRTIFQCQLSFRFHAELLH
jgi:hypothetical protein